MLDWIRECPELWAALLGSVVYATVLALVVHVTENPWRIHFWCYAWRLIYVLSLALAAALHALIAGFTAAGAMNLAIAAASRDAAPSPLAKFATMLAVMHVISYVCIRRAKLNEAWGYVQQTSGKFATIVSHYSSRNVVSALSDVAGELLNQLEDETPDELIDALFEEHKNDIIERARERAAHDPSRADGVARTRNRRQKLEHLVMYLGYHGTVRCLRRLVAAQKVAA